jgi:hypothetical protein
LREAAKHDAAHGGMDHCDAYLGQAFTVAGQTTGTGEPGEIRSTIYRHGMTWKFLCFSSNP